MSCPNWKVRRYPVRRPASRASRCSGLTREQIEYLISIGAIVRRVPEGNA